LLTLTIKPHHLIDIFKLYGAGREVLYLDPAYEHDFYRVGNIILNHPDTIVRLYLGSDDICRPCRYNLAGQCIDKLKTPIGEFTQKELWNRHLDVPLLAILGLTENTELTAREFCAIALSALNTENIATVWAGLSSLSIKMRAEYTLRGLQRYQTRWAADPDLT
jgi:hypothetical protein